jgi:acetyl-CoA synthetase
MIRTIYGDNKRCKDVYFSNFEGYYFTGDGARRDNGMYRIIGRVDDVINVSGHRFGTAEIENAINSNNLVNESAVVGYRHPIKGQGIYAFVILEHGVDLKGKISITKSISESVERSIGKIARPDIIQITKGLPKTRSGKIMRRILRKIANGEPKDIGDTSTLLDPSIVESLVEGQKH